MRRTFAIVGWVVLVLLALAVLAASVALVALDTQAGRARACRALTELVDDSVKGSLRIGRCVQLTPSRLRLEQVELLDPAGRTVVSLRSLTVRPDIGALFRRRLRVLDVDVAGPAVHLTAHEGQLDLLTALAPRVPATGSASEPPAFVIDRLRIRGGRVDGLPEGLTVERIALELGLGFDQHLSAAVRSASADVSRSGEAVARLRDTRGAVELGPDGQSALAATLQFVPGSDRIEIDARTRWTDGGPGPLEAHARFALSPDLLTRLGQPEAAGAFAAPIEGTATIQGTLADLAAQGRLDTAGGTVRLTGRWREERLEAQVQTDGLELGRVLTSLEHGLLAGTFAATLGPPAAGTHERPIDLSIRDGRFETFVVPSSTAQGVLGADHVRLTSLEIPNLTGADGRLDVDARLGFDGSLAVRLDAVLPQLAADGNVRRLAPEVRAGLEAHLRASPCRDGHAARWPRPRCH